MKYMTLAEDFVDFVQTMPAGHPIDHTSRADENVWCRCAVGEFFQARVGDKLDAGHDDRPYELQESLEAVGLSFVFELLNLSEPDTYGELQAVIAAAQQGVFDEYTQRHIDHWQAYV